MSERKPASLWLCELAVTENVRRREQLAEVIAREDPEELRGARTSGPVSARWVKAVAGVSEELEKFALLHCDDVATITEVVTSSVFPKTRALLVEFGDDWARGERVRAERFFWVTHDVSGVLAGLEKNALARHDFYGDAAWRRGVAELPAPEALVYLQALVGNDAKWREKIATAVLLQYYGVEGGSLVFYQHPLDTLGEWCVLSTEEKVNALAQVVEQALVRERGTLDVRLFVDLETALGDGNAGVDAEVLVLEMAFDYKGDLGYRWCSEAVFEWLRRSSLVGLLALHPLSSHQFREWLGTLDPGARYLGWRQFSSGGMRSREDLIYFLDQVDEVVAGGGGASDSSFSDNMSNGVLDLCYGPEDPLFLRIRDGAEETSVLNYLSGKWYVGGTRLWPSREDLLAVYSARVVPGEQRRWGRVLGEVAASQGPGYWRQGVLEGVPWALSAALERAETYSALYTQLRGAGARADLVIEHLNRARSEAVTLADLRVRLVAFTKALDDTGGHAPRAHSEFLDVSSTPTETRNYEYAAIGTAKRVGSQ